MSTSNDLSSKPSTSTKEPVLSQKITWNPWLAVVFVVVTYFVSQFLAELALYVYPLFKHWSLVQANSWITSSIWAQFIYVVLAEGLTLGAIYLFLRFYKVSWRAIAWRKPKWSDPAWGLAFVPLYFLSYIVVVALVHTVVPNLNINQTQQIGFDGVQGFGPLLLTFLSLVILPPLVEEIIIRGFLYTSLKKNLPQVAAALIASVVFASGHLQAGSGAPLLWIAFIDTFVLSLFLIYLREKTNGLWASMTLHAGKNLIAFISLFILHLS